MQVSSRMKLWYSRALFFVLFLNTLNQSKYQMRATVALYSRSPQGSSMKSVWARQANRTKTIQQQKTWVKMKQGSTEAKSARAVRRERSRSRFHRKWMMEEMMDSWFESFKKERRLRWYVVTQKATAAIEHKTFSTKEEEKCG